MFTECNVTNMRNGIDSSTFQSESHYWCEIINYFQCFLIRKYKGKYAVNVCLKNAKQYIDWYFLNNVDKYFILNKENYSKYEFYLKNTKKYKKSTITSKMISLRKFNKFLIEFNQLNSNEESFNYLKRNKSQYNYLTESHIRL